MQGKARKRKPRTRQRWRPLRSVFYLTLSGNSANPATACRNVLFLAVAISSVPLPRSGWVPSRACCTARCYYCTLHALYPGVSAMPKYETAENIHPADVTYSHPRHNHKPTKRSLVLSLPITPLLLSIHSWSPSYWAEERSCCLSASRTLSHRIRCTRPTPTTKAGRRDERCVAARWVTAYSNIFGTATERAATWSDAS